MRSLIIISLVLFGRISSAQYIVSTISHKQLITISPWDGALKTISNELYSAIKSAKLKIYYDTIQSKNFTIAEFDSIERKSLGLRNLIIANKLMLKATWNYSNRDNEPNPFYFCIEDIKKLDNKLLKEWLYKFFYSSYVRSLNPVDFKSTYKNVFITTYNKLITDSFKNKLAYYQFNNFDWLDFYDKKNWINSKLIDLNLNKIKLKALPITLSYDFEKKYSFAISGFQMLVVFKDEKKYKLEYLGFTYDNLDRYRENFEYPTSPIFFKYNHLKIRDLFNGYEKQVLESIIEQMRYYQHTRLYEECDD